MTVAAEWRSALESWAIPEEILSAAPESPWGFPPSLFVRSAAAALQDSSPTPSRLRALERLGESADESVLDVGAGGGAASLPLAPPAELLVAVDESEAMLERFAVAADERGAGHEQLLGRWPDIAPSAPQADLVVCHHVFYNVQDLVPFVVALSQHARRRVVVELTAEHPMSGLNPLWLAIHDLERPTRPVAADGLAVVREIGLGAEIAYFEKPSLWDHAPVEERVAFARRLLCTGPESDELIRAHFVAVQQSGEERRRLATIWWDV